MSRDAASGPAPRLLQSRASFVAAVIRQTSTA